MQPDRLQNEVDATGRSDLLRKEAVRVELRAGAEVFTSEHDFARMILQSIYVRGNFPIKQCPLSVRLILCFIHFIFRR